jgi:hypothetical protein
VSPGIHDARLRTFLRILDIPQSWQEVMLEWTAQGHCRERLQRQIARVVNNTTSAAGSETWPVFQRQSSKFPHSTATALPPGFQWQTRAATKSLHSPSWRSRRFYVHSQPAYFPAIIITVEICPCHLSVRPLGECKYT